MGVGPTVDDHECEEAQDEKEGDADGQVIVGQRVAQPLHLEFHSDP